MRIVLDCIIKGISFDALRARLSELGGYASRKEDVFVFPNDSHYPQRSPMLKVDRHLFSRSGRNPFEPYTPDGYL